jgi:hypothetical protein
MPNEGWIMHGSVFGGTEIDVEQCRFPYRGTDKGVPLNAEYRCDQQQQPSVQRQPLSETSTDGVLVLIIDNNTG